MPETLTARPTGAVFLSYARDDAAAARRIAEALRASGFEVWFDESELRGGDAWDAKIRRQIKECALFLPVVSAHTQARGEGYFRLEWKLAVERTHLMAEGLPFLAPVVIDDTKEAAAVVPAEFMRVQWTHLPGALPTPQFVEQISRLLAQPRTPPASHPASPHGESTGAQGKSGLPVGVWVTLGVVAVALGVVFTLRKPEPAAAPAKPVTVTAPTAPAAPAVSEKSIAVIPFENRSDDKANAYFTDGVHEDILTSLANLRELRVISRTSVMEYRGTTKKMGQIARELGVAYILEGSVQRSGNTVRITGQLIRAATDEHVWARNYDRELTASNLFAIQSELAQAIAAELKAAISPQEKTQLERPLTANLAAYDVYSKAREIFYARGNDIAAMFKEAVPLYEQAVQLDPKFAEAWGMLGIARSLAYNRGIERSPAAQARAREAIQTGLRLAPDNPLAILGLAQYYYLVEADYVRALAECERAARISPNIASVYYNMSNIYVRQSRYQEAVAASRKACELEPGSSALARSLGNQLFLYAHRYAEAEEHLRRAAALQPEYLEVRAVLATIAFWARGSTREWEDLLASLPPSAYNNGAFQTVHLSFVGGRGDAAGYAKLVERYGSESRGGFGYPLALMILGEKERARKAAAKVRDEQLDLLAREPDNAQVLGRLSFAYLVLGEDTAALEAAEKSIGASTSGALSPAVARLRRAQLLAWLGRKDEALSELNRLWWQPLNPRDPLTSFMWSPLHDDPRFEAIKNDPRNGQPLF